MTLEAYEKVTTQLSPGTVAITVANVVPPSPPPPNDNSNPQQGTGTKPPLMFKPTAVGGATSPLTEESSSQGGGGNGAPAVTTKQDLEQAVAAAAAAAPRVPALIPSIDVDGKKTINQVKIPATQHDNRKLFVGGLPTNGESRVVYGNLA